MKLLTEFLSKFIILFVKKITNRLFLVEWYQFIPDLNWFYIRLLDIFAPIKSFMSMYRYFIHLAYDGTRFHGWQRQPNAITVQEVLEDALSMMTGEPLVLTGAGRTDTGVHARNYYAHVDLSRAMDTVELDRLAYRLNSYLGEDLVIYRIFRVVSSAHARFSAQSRTYTYHIARIRDPFCCRYQHTIHGPLDLQGMIEGAGILMEYRDFTSFSKVDTDTKTNICQITEAIWRVKDQEMIFTITADRFLRNMVRAIVGTLISIGQKKIFADDLRGIIESQDRSKAGQSAPARGLILESICYPGSIFGNQ